LRPAVTGSTNLCVRNNRPYTFNVLLLTSFRTDKHDLQIERVVFDGFITRKMINILVGRLNLMFIDTNIRGDKKNHNLFKIAVLFFGKHEYIVINHNHRFIFWLQWLIYVKNFKCLGVIFVLLKWHSCLLIDYSSVFVLHMFTIHTNITIIYVCSVKSVSKCWSKQQYLQNGKKCSGVYILYYIQ